MSSESAPHVASAASNSSSPEKSPIFLELAASRREWIDSVLRPWCRTVELKDLRQAELEWLDLAGKVDPAATLWTWAWERFPDLVHPDFPGVHETHRVEVQLKDQRTFCGYPDSRNSRRGTLILVDRTNEGLIETGPLSIDHILQVNRLPY
ncbi:MAG: hypothetical protein JNL58_17910 [Planctomyces sp.]|nr:hypothetical protein [Planctomyces sp.]